MRVKGNPSRVAWSLVWFAGFGCSSQLGEIGERAPEPEVRLLASHQGAYRITRDGQLVGAERYTVTSSAGSWSVKGEISLTWPLEQTQRYQLDFDPEHRRPLRFEISIELMGERQQVRGENDGQYVRGEIKGIDGNTPYEVAYGPGTMLDFGSPLFGALLFTLLNPALESSAPIAVRSIVVPVPFLRPAVLLQELRFAGREGELRKIAFGPSGRRPAAYWVRADGLPVKLKTWADEGGAPFVYDLEL